MNFPIKTSELSAYLPHRPPMVWIDEVTAANELGGEARLILKADAFYMSEGRLRPSAVIEFIAQTFGYVAACRILQDPLVKPAMIQKAFLVGVRSAELDEVIAKNEWTPGERLLVRVGNLKQIGPMQILDGTVLLEASTDRAERVLASANLKLYSE